MSERRRFGNRPNRSGPQQQGQPQRQQQRRGPGPGPQQHRNNNGQSNHHRQQGDYRPTQSAGGPPVEFLGLLALSDDRRDAELRDPAHPLRPSTTPVVIPRSVIRDMHLRPGLLLQGRAHGRTLDSIDLIEGRITDDYAKLIPLYECTALDPEPVLKLEHNPAEPTTRVIDILAPIGFGQRGLIVAPPRTGKTMLLQNMARGIAANYPDAKLFLLLIDERPEEVTDMRRNVPGQVFASSNDNTIDKHLDLAQTVIERAKRLVEFGQNVVILMDSLTRVGRAFNAGGPSGGRTMSGGLDNRALEIPKKLFGAARKLENGGSLTILATCLIDTGSRMDQVIFEEFKGTGNMELTLDRNISNLRIWPAINIAESGTRKEEKLLGEKTLAAARQIRRHLMNMPPPQAMKYLIEALRKHPTNQSLLDSMRPT